MATELKTDSWHRYMLYRRDDQALMPFASQEEKQKAIDDGRKYVLSAASEVWARDDMLVQRLRIFLGVHFHWHDRLVKTGSNLQIVSTLHDMLRSNNSSVVVIPEKSQSNGGGSPSSMQSQLSSFWGSESYKQKPFVSVAERYQRQLERMNAESPTWAEAQATMNEVNSTFMHAAVLADPLGTLPLFAKAGRISKYGLPDLSAYGVDDVEDANTSSSLADAQPFEYLPDQRDGDSFDIAKTPNNGEPGTWYTNPGSGQMRLYGEDGKGYIDLDFDHTHDGMRPHAHNWVDGNRDWAVVPFSPL